MSINVKKNLIVFLRQEMKKLSKEMEKGYKDPWLTKMAEIRLRNLQKAYIEVSMV